MINSTYFQFKFATIYSVVRATKTGKISLWLWFLYRSLLGYNFNIGWLVMILTWVAPSNNIFDEIVSNHEHFSKREILDLEIAHYEKL